MPWLEVNPMDQKLLFIADYLRLTGSFSSLCLRYGISRKTGYKWVARYQQGGYERLVNRSRKPVFHPHQTPYVIRKAIVALRKCGSIELGPKKIQALLAERFPHERIPSRTTIYNILNKEGLVKKRRKRRRVPLFPDPFEAVDKPNQVWSADFKGQFKMMDGNWCFPLTVMDHDSRYLLGCEGLSNTKTSGAQPVFERLFREYGLPQRIRTDNGVPFATRAAGGLSKLSIWWVKLGIRPERIEPGKPQQNGRHERMHRTLKLAVTQPPAKDMTDQQLKFDGFSRDYNDHRPHEGLQQKTPASLYQRSERVFSKALAAPSYPDYFERRKVGRNGTLHWHNRLIYISYVFHGETVGFCEVDDGIHEVYFGPVLLGTFDEKEAVERKKSYISLRV